MNVSRFASFAPACHRRLPPFGPSTFRSFTPHVPVCSTPSSSARLTPRAFHHDLPPEAITLWRFDLKNADQAMYIPGEKPPLFWGECLDGYLMKEILQI